MYYYLAGVGYGIKIYPYHPPLRNLLPQHQYFCQRSSCPTQVFQLPYQRVYPEYL